MQKTNNKRLQMQIDAGVAGRQKGHKYENDLADALND